MKIHIWNFLGKIVYDSIFLLAREVWGCLRGGLRLQDLSFGKIEVGFAQDLELILQTITSRW